MFKHDKQSLRDVVVDDGLHVHGVAFVPPWARLTEPLDVHFERDRARYVADTAIDRIDIAPITHSLVAAVDYALKGAKQGRLGADAVLILSRARREMMDAVRNSRCEWTYVRRRERSQG